MTLVGPQIAAGDKAPDFHLATKDLSTATLETVLDGGKRAALLIVVPSLDTSVCQLESRSSTNGSASLRPASRATSSAWTCRSQ